jgi:hypothetical protein
MRWPTPATGSVEHGIVALISDPVPRESAVARPAHDRGRGPSTWSPVATRLRHPTELPFVAFMVILNVVIVVVIVQAARILPDLPAARWRGLADCP